MKIAITGNAGSGKSTLGLMLHKKLRIPLYHLDQYYWGPHWQEPDPLLFEKAHHELCDRDTWIIEGVATRILEYRIQRADIVIFLNMPTHRCLYRVFKRMILGFGTVRLSSAPQCPERIPDLKFLRFIWRFNKERKPIIEALLRDYKDQKQTFTIRNTAELDDLIQQLMKKAPN